MDNQCCECKETLNEGALRCHSCGSYQNWKRFLNFGHLSAGLFLICVSILAAPPIAKLFHEDKVDFKISILEGDMLKFKFMLANAGNLPAALTKIEIENNVERGGTWYVESDLKNKLIAPGKAYIITASNGSAIPEPIDHEVRCIYNDRFGKPIKNNCNLVIKYIELNGTKAYLYYPFPCRIPIKISDWLKYEKKAALPKTDKNIIDPNTR